MRKETETVEIDYPLEKVWKNIPKALKELEWSIESIDEKTRQVKAKTPKGYILWSTALQLDVFSVDNKTTRIKATSETPFTTISSIVDLGRSKRRTELFFAALAKQLNPPKQQEPVDKAQQPK